MKMPAPQLPPALAAVRRAVARHGLIRPGDKVLVAWSGGPDSTALLHLLLELRLVIPFTVAAAHFNHRLRPSADADAAFVKREAARLGVPFLSARRDVRAFARSRKLNLEDAARLLRYAFLNRAAERLGANRIATGHTLDDQAETVLIRLLRGSGPRGLSGIHPSVGGAVIRPLLDARRADVLEYCRRRKLGFRRDETNADPRYVRNRIRHKLLPYLERNYGPGLPESLGRLADISREEDEFLEAVAGHAFARLLSRRRAGRSPSLDATRLADLSPALARRCVRLFLAELKGDLLAIGFDDVEAVRGLAEGETVTLPGGLVLRHVHGALAQAPAAPEPASRPDYFYLWDGRGRLPVPEAGMAFAGRRLRSPGAPRPAYDDAASAICDLDALTLPLAVRPRLEGDRYKPFGAPGRKKLKEILRAKRIPAAERGALPVFCSGEEIVWAPGLPVADAFKVTPATKRVLEIRKVELPRSGARAGRAG